MAVRSVDLTEHFEAFIDNGVQSGRFKDSSEVVREGLRLLEREEARDRAKLEWLRGAVAEGVATLDRGEGVRFNSFDDLELFFDELEEEVASESGRE